MTPSGCHSGDSSRRFRIAAESAETHAAPKPSADKATRKFSTAAPKDAIANSVSASETRHGTTRYGARSSTGTASAFANAFRAVSDSNSTNRHGSDPSAEGEGDGDRNGDGAVTAAATARRTASPETASEANVSVSR